MNYEQIVVQGNVLLPPATYMQHCEKIIASNKHISSVPQPVLGVRMPAHTASQHFLIAGQQGAGKSVHIQLLLSSVLPGYVGVKKGHCALINDPKNEIAQTLEPMGFSVESGNVVLLNPLDKRASKINLCKDIQDLRQIKGFLDIVITASKASNQLNTGNRQEKDAHWETQVRALIEAVITVFVERYQHSGEPWELQDIVDACLSMEDGPLELLELLDESRSRTTRKAKRILAQSSPDSEYFQSILGTLDEIIDPWVEVAECWENIEKTVSVKDFLNADPGYIVIMGQVEDSLEACMAVNNLFSGLVTSNLLTTAEHTAERGNSRRIWIVQDEGCDFGAQPKLIRLLDKGRNLGVSVIFSFHTVAQLRRIYGDLFEDFLGKFGNLALLTTEDAETASWMSKKCGQQKVVESVSFNPAHSRKPVKGIPGAVHVGNHYGTRGPSRPDSIVTKLAPVVEAHEFHEGRNSLGIKAVYKSEIGLCSVFYTFEEVARIAPGKNSTVKGFISSGR